MIKTSGNSLALFRYICVTCSKDSSAQWAPFWLQAGGQRQAGENGKYQAMHILMAFFTARKSTIIPTFYFKVKIIEGEVILHR